MRNKQRRGVALLTAVGLVAIVAIVSGVFAWKRMQAAAIAEHQAKALAPNYGARTELIALLRARIEREPCDQKAIVELAETLMQAGDARATLRHASPFLAKCGEHARLRWLTYAAHKQLSEWDQAAREAEKLIEHDPYDADYRGWRGLMYERKGDYRRAVEDYRQALILRPGLVDLPLNLADAYVKIGQPCDAILPLAQAVFQYPNATNAGGVHARIAELSAMPQCAWVAGEGRTARIKNEAGGVVVVRARINERNEGNFVIDTGASLVVLARSFARQIGVDDNGGKILAQTANGVAAGNLTVLDKIELQGVRANRVGAVVVDGLASVDGLLGMSFLTRFDVRHNAGVLEISARKPQ
jgi:clan AA aspartic protease (TIGR02281 family)